MADLNLKILSFKKVLFQDIIQSIVIPGAQGDISINNVGRNYVYLLQSGIIYIFNNNKVVKRFFVLEGNFQIKDKEIFINTIDDFFDLDNLDANLINNQISYYDGLLNNCHDEIKKDFYLNKINSYKKIIESKNIYAY